MKKFALIGGAAILACSSLAHSAEEGAGCGIGSVLLEGKEGKGANIVAAVLNTFIIPNTFFMTTGGGLLGCDPTQTVQREELTEIFVAQNMDQLTTDTAKGSGDYLTTLAALMEVPEGDVPHFAALAQNQFDALFMDGNNAAGVIESLHMAMQNDPKLSQIALN